MASNDEQTPKSSSVLYLSFAELRDREIVLEVALQLANHYAKLAASKKQWKRLAKQKCRWQREIRPAAIAAGVADAPQVFEFTSLPFHLSDFIKQLGEEGAFDHNKYALPDPMCYWLDGSVMAAPDLHAVATNGPYALTFRGQTELGPRFPMMPSLDREGATYTSFQTLLIRRITRLHNALIIPPPETTDADWFETFRGIVSEVISLVENTLHQLYFKAEYDPLPSWRFEKAELGERHDRSSEKMKWVYQITRVRLEANLERAAYLRLKTIRNHLQHFDPPCFAFSWEEMAGWLNDVLLVAQLTWRIRQCAGALPSLDLIKLLLQKRVQFRPRDPKAKRLPPHSKLGYASTTEAMLKEKEVPDLGYESITIRRHTTERIL